MTAQSQDRFRALLQKASAEYDLLRAEIDHLQAQLATQSNGIRAEVPGVVEIPKQMKPRPLELTSMGPQDHNRQPSSPESAIISVLPTPVATISQMNLDSSPAGAIHKSGQSPGQLKKDVQRVSDECDLNSPSNALAKLLRKITTATFREEGVVASIARSKQFEMFTISMVVFNGIWIAIDADYNNASFLLDADPVFQIADHFFCLVFTMEVAIRWLAFRYKRAAFADPWFVFDAALVLLMALETWVMTIVLVIVEGDSLGINVSVLRLLRLVRLSRLSRVIRAVPELSFMVKGVLQATRSVACAMSLLLGILYVFGIALKQLSQGTKMGSKYFPSVPHAIFTLFVQGTLLDSITTLMADVRKESVSCFIILLIVVVLAAFTLMNMLVGVLCEVMNRVALEEKERMAFNFAKDIILQALSELDVDHDELISRKEFMHLVTNAEANDALRDVGVDVVALVDFADYFFQSDKYGEHFDERWSFDEFMEKIMQVRGVNPATVRDTVDLQKFIHSANTRQTAMLKHMQENLTTLARNQTKLERLLLNGNGGTQS